MVNCTYDFNNFAYISDADFVSVQIDYTRHKGNSIQNRRWVWKGTHSAAKSLDLDNAPGQTFAGRNVQVILGLKGEGIPVQVCQALEKMEKKFLEECEQMVKTVLEEIEKKHLNDDIASIISLT